jgi:AcrR family transcriptional regulator
VIVSVDRTSAPTRSRLATRERLIEAATHLFATEGLHSVTSHDIAREAGVAAGTFYLHFRDKHDIFREIAFEAVQGLRKGLEQATERAGASLQSAVRARAEELLRFAEQNRDLVQILFGRENRAADVGADVLEALAEWAERHWRARIQGGSVRADLHPTVVAQGVLGMLARVVAWWAEEPERAPRESVVRTLTQLQLSGAYPES